MKIYGRCVSLFLFIYSTGRSIGKSATHESCAQPKRVSENVSNEAANVVVSAKLNVQKKPEFKCNAKPFCSFALRFQTPAFSF